MHGWSRWLVVPVAVLAAAGSPMAASDIRDGARGFGLDGGGDAANLWWTSSGWKIGVACPAPTNRADTIEVRAARNEAEAVQLVIAPRRALPGVTVEVSPLTGPNGVTLPASMIDLLRVAYLDIATPTDASAKPGPWPDPLPRWTAPVDLAAGANQPVWIRANVPKTAPAGAYTGTVTAASSDGWRASVPLALTVYNFGLPDRMTCETAFGFSPGTVFRYHGAKTEEQKRTLLAKYWDTFSSHHISPYDPAPLDPFRVRWPDVKPPPSRWADWDGVRVATNESAGGSGALVLFDDRRDACVSASFKPLIPIPSNGGLRLSFRYRTALPGQEAMVSVNHHDASGAWMSGCNNDMVVTGNGRWEAFDRTLTEFPKGAASVRLHFWAARWTEAGERTGLVWLDDVSARAAAGGPELVTGGDFEPPEIADSGLPDEKLQVSFDFAAWDTAMRDAVSRYRFNTFRLPVEGLGGGTFFEHAGGSLRGFPEYTREYGVMLASYLGGLEKHLRDRGLLDRAFVYWFDEPDPHQYDFVREGFLKLKRHAPGLRRMLTEQPEPGLFGGPDIWCPVSSSFNESAAAARMKEGERFWWYVCCGPKAPYCTLFIDHPGTELRAWLWQTFQRNISGILVWETVYWHSETAYPGEARQNPWTDPMSWTSGYGVPAGTKQPWGNGDGRFLYPPPAAASGDPGAPVLEAPVESIRWEMLRDGVEDYEYLCLVRRALASRTDLSPETRKHLEGLLTVPADITASLTDFTKDPAPIEARRDRIARALEDLAAP